MPADRGTIEELFKGMKMLVNVLNGENSLFDNNYLTAEEELEYARLEEECRKALTFREIRFVKK